MDVLKSLDFPLASFTSNVSSWVCRVNSLKAKGCPWVKWTNSTIKTIYIQLQCMVIVVSVGTQKNRHERCHVSIIWHYLALLVIFHVMWWERRREKKLYPSFWRIWVKPYSFLSNYFFVKDFWTWKFCCKAQERRSSKI